MPIRPKPYIVKCIKCNFKKIIAPKSDALGVEDLIYQCPKCGGEVKRKSLNINLPDYMIKILQIFI